MHGPCTYGKGTYTGGCSCERFRSRKGGERPTCRCGHEKAFHIQISDTETVAKSRKTVSTPSIDALESAAKALESAAAFLKLAIGQMKQTDEKHTKVSSELKSHRPSGVGPRVILTAVAQHRDGVTREQITILTGYKRSTRDAYLQRLRASDFVEEYGNMVYATNAGTRELGEDFKPLPTGEKLREHWLSKLPEGERKILDVVCCNYPESISRDLVGERTGFKRSTRDAYIQRLKTRKLVIVSRSELRASEELFR